MRPLRPSTRLLLLLALGSVSATNPGGFPNSLGRTPPRGVRTWNSRRLAVDQPFLSSLVDGLVAPLPGGGSLFASSFTDVGLDDGWEACGSGVNGSYHDASGQPLVNRTLFPDMRAMTTAARAKGVTMSWYHNCCGCGAGEHRLSEPHYSQDAAATVALGFAGLKIDGCGNEPNMTAWATALFETGTGIVLENCNDDHPFRPSIAPDGSIDCPYNFFRTSIDGAPNWRSTIWNILQTLPFLDVSSPGCFAYADMLTFGVPAVGFESSSFFTNCGGKRLSDSDARAQFAAFALLSSPLILGFDVGNATERALWGPIITHAPTLARNAAWDGEAGRLVARDPNVTKVSLAVGGACELMQQYELPSWMVIGKRLASHSDGSTSSFAAIVVAGDWVPGGIDFAAPLTSMGFAPGVTVSSADGWTGADTGDITSGAWEEHGVAAPGGMYRVFTAAA